MTAMSELTRTERERRRDILSGVRYHKGALDFLVHDALEAGVPTTEVAFHLGLDRGTVKRRYVNAGRPQPHQRPGEWERLIECLRGWETETLGSEDRWVPFYVIARSCRVAAQVAYMDDAALRDTIRNRGWRMNDEWWDGEEWLIPGRNQAADGNDPSTCGGHHKCGDIPCETCAEDDHAVGCLPC